MRPSRRVKQELEAQLEDQRKTMEDQRKTMYAQLDDQRKAISAKLEDQQDAIGVLQAQTKALININVRVGMRAAEGMILDLFDAALPAGAPTFQQLHSNNDERDILVRERLYPWLQERRDTWASRSEAVPPLPAMQHNLYRFGRDSSSAPGWKVINWDILSSDPKLLAEHLQFLEPGFDRDLFHIILLELGAELPAKPGASQAGPVKRGAPQLGR